VVSKPHSSSRTKRSSGSAGASSKKISIARLAALKTLKLVFAGKSLSAIQSRFIDQLEDRRDRGLAGELVNGVLRWRWREEFYIAQLLSKPLKARDSDVQLVLLMALYELTECRTPDYAVINDAVELVRKSGKKWAASLVNAVLRRFLREQAQLSDLKMDEQASYSHPQWLIKRISSDWPDTWQQILQANNQRPAFWLRINQSCSNVSDYQKLLAGSQLDSETSLLSNSALRLSQGTEVKSLPGFDEGMISVQDAGAQLAATLMNINEDDIYQVLDLCAAPGGKTCHLLERYSNIGRLVAVESDAHRMQRVAENLQRLKLNAEMIVADARDYKKWWNGEMFDRILLDAPCTATGVIRRHPDIKTLRRESDIAQLQNLQSGILLAAWQMLKPGGELLYVTCSVLKDENERQIARFISENKNTSADAVEIKIKADWGEGCQYGRQLMPGEQDADGFYYCRLGKRQ
jgi:16S rRNA (cytosine967-C5)-methyltransferase